MHLESYGKREGFLIVHFLCISLSYSKHDMNDDENHEDDAYDLVDRRAGGLPYCSLPPRCTRLHLMCSQPDHC